jgi:hypothetical protein
MRLASVLREKPGLVLALICSASLVSRVAPAQIPSPELPSTTDKAAARAPAGPLTVWVDTGAGGFDKAKLRASLEQELGREVALTDDVAAAAVQIRFEGAAHVAVHFTTPSGEQLSRKVALPPDRERSVEVVSWLTVNLVRDEASELLDELRARRKKEADARAAADRVAVDTAAADRAAADKSAAGKVAADKAAAEAARKRADQAKIAENAAGGPPKKPGGNEGLLRDRLRSFDLALATPTSILRDSPQRVLMLQLALGYGEAGGIEGISSSMLALRVRRDLRGVALGLGASIIGGSTRGIVVSGGYSHLGLLEGIAIAGGAVWQRGRLARGAVIAGGGAFASDLSGLALGGGVASAKSLDGVALAGGITLVRGPSKGLLLAGGANFSADHRGVQLAGGLNAARDLQGIALAPLNVHRRVKGLQLGIVNVADEVDGAAFGIISLAKNGRLQPVLWTSLDRSVHVALKSIVGWAFTQIGGGIDLNGNAFTYDGGVGLHLRLSNKFFLEPGLHYSASNDTDDASGAPDKQQLRYMAELGYRAGDKVDLLAGVGVRHTFIGGSGARLAPELQAGIAFF